MLKKQWKNGCGDLKAEDNSLKKFLNGIYTKNINYYLPEEFWFSYL